MKGRPSRQVASGRCWEHFDGEPRDGGHCFEAPDHVRALGEQRVAELLQDGQGEVVEIHLGECEVGHEFIGVRLVVRQLRDSPLARVERQDNTQVVLDGQPLCRWCPI